MFYTDRVPYRLNHLENSATQALQIQQPSSHRCVPKTCSLVWVPNKIYNNVNRKWK
ncbi:hypothetical protein Hanom_Chr05g00448601 [Helianthus anomalus]